MQIEGEQIGRSRLTKVFRRVVDGKALAVKVYNRLKMQHNKSYDFKEMRYTDGQDFLRRELAAYQLLIAQSEHTNFVPRFFGKKETPQNVELYLELADVPLAAFDGERVTYSSWAPALDLTTPEGRRRVYREMLEALAFVHNQGLAHLDVKLENYLLFSYRLKLADFNSARPCSPSILHFSPYGTFLYAAPETLCDLEDGYDPFKADVWAFGICVFVISEQRLPFPLSEDAVMVQLEYENAVRTAEVEIKKSQGSEAAFILRALQKNPRLRPTASELLDDLFLYGEEEPSRISSLKSSMSDC